LLVTLNTIYESMKSPRSCGQKTPRTPIEQQQAKGDDNQWRKRIGVPFTTEALETLSVDGLPSADTSYHCAAAQILLSHVRQK